MKKLIGILCLMLASLNANAGIPVLMYHEVVSDSAGIAPDDTIVTVSSFNAQMKWLNDNGYYTVSAAELATYMKTGQIRTKRNKQPIVITFDDGWYNQQNALPALDRYGFKAVFNIIAAIPGNDPSYMNWKKIRDLSGKGHEIASHTMTHPYNMTSNVYGYEIIQSKATIESVIRKQVMTIAWPNGYFNDDMLNMASSIGYIGTQTIDDNWCTKSNVSLEGTPDCQWLTGNTYGQNPYMMKRIFVDGRCTAIEIGTWITQGHASPCSYTNVPGIVAVQRAMPVLGTLQKLTPNMTDDSDVPRYPRDVLDRNNDGLDRDDLDTKNHRKSK